MHTVEWGGSLHGTVVPCIRHRACRLLASVLLFVTATVSTINSGVATTPLVVLFPKVPWRPPRSW